MSLPPLPVLFGDIAACIGFYTRLPVPARHDPDRRFADSQWAAPLAGLVVGLVAGAAWWLAAALGLPATIAAAAALGAGMLATGCLHEDGLADVADGFGGGDTAGRKLAIMRDSHIGTYGVAALVVVLLAKWAALAALAGAAAALWALLAAHAASRALPPALMHVMPRARDDGLSARVGMVEAPVAMSGLGIGFLALLVFLGISAAFVAAALLAIWLLVLRQLADRQIGGQTGDVLGALQQGGELIVLLVALAHFA